MFSPFLIQWRPLIHAVVFMSLMTTASTASLGQNSAEASAAEKAQVEAPLSGYYSVACYQDTDQAEIIKEVQNVLASMDRQEPAIKTLVHQAIDKRSLYAEALEKRFLIVVRQREYIKSLLTASNRDALLFAQQSAHELATLLDYFQKEQARFSQSAAGSESRISVKDFGALGDGVTDDAPAIRSAINWAKESGKKVTIVFPKGRYFLSDIAENAEWPKDMPNSLESISWGLWRNVHLPILGLKHCVIEGEDGTQLLCDRPTRTAISMIGCEDVLVKNLSIDYVNLPFTQGIIRSVNPQDNTFILDIDKGYPSPTAPNFVNAVGPFGVAYNAADKKPIWKGKDKFIGRIDKMDDGGFQFEIKRGGFEALAPGVKFAMVARYDATGSAINVRGSEFCTFVNVTIYSSPGVAFMAGMTDAMSLIGCKIEPLPGSERLISANGDGFQFVNGSVGPFMQGCSFHGMYDDGFMVSTRSAQIREMAEDGLSLKTIPSLFRSGDRLAVISQEDGTIQAITRIVSVKVNADAELKFSSPLPRFETLKDLGMTELAFKEMFEYYVGGKKFAKFPKLVMNLSISNSGTVVMDNEFRDHRGTGIKIQTPNAFIHGNQISGIQYVGISLTSFILWREPFIPCNIVIEDNVVRDVSTGIAVFYSLDGKKNADSRPIRHLLIQHNRIEDPLRAFVYLNNAQDIVIANNIFSSASTKEFNMDNAMNIEVRECLFKYPNASSESIIDKSIWKDTVRFSNNNFNNSF